MKRQLMQPYTVFPETETVIPDISAREEYALYRRVLTNTVLKLPEMKAAVLKTVLQARIAGLQLLRDRVSG